MRRAGFQLRCRQREGGVRGHGDADFGGGGVAAVVHAGDRGFGRRIAPVHQAQRAAFENGCLMCAAGAGRDGVQVREEAVGGAVVRQHLCFQRRVQLQAPRAVACAERPRHALGGVALLQILRRELLALAGGQCERDGAGAMAGVVHRVNGNLAADVRGVDHAQKPLRLASRRGGRRGEDGNPVCRHVPVARWRRGRNREIGQPSILAGEQMRRVNGLVRPQD